MESFVHLRKGRTPRRLHADLDGLKDDELGRGGFTGRTANMYRRNDPTAYRSAGPLRPIDVLSSELKPSDATDANGGPMLMFSNADCQVLLSRRTEPMPFFVRYVDGDLLSFVHRGCGLLETEFGPLRYRQGDWVYIPKACTFRQVPDSGEHGASTLLMIQATDEFRVPPPGQLGRHFPFDPSQAVIPEPEPIAEDGRDEYEVRLIHSPIGGVGTTALFYQHHPLDVEGWRGDNFAFTFNIADYNVITSDSVHLPPTVHLFMQATGVYVMNFLPKPAEGVAGTERTPWYHRNVDYDEIAFFHGGSLYGIL
ncbi:MAG TPA: homogentisate 1,2-dioxygenase, partial [Mycobacterium sp.]|nr:homogentisate 1,2-dioxygenase [Mycobacterium sp.]